ncbi:MAG: hypothetical protein V3V00_04395 [Saprospiraceae bacterium]
MFIGHYAPALFLKGVENKASLGMLFIAVQFVDILFFPFVLMGIERLNIVPDFTPSTHFELIFYPYTHGLLASVLWGLAFYLIYRILIGKTKRNSIIIGIAVLSHWFLDLLVHTPDLPLLGDNSLKLGFGIWNNSILTFVVEAGLLFAGLWYYLKNTNPVNNFIGKYGIILFSVFMLVLAYLNLFVLPAPENKIALTVSALGSYTMLTVSIRATAYI